MDESLVRGAGWLAIQEESRYGSGFGHPVIMVQSPRLE
jgi:hypothetical protein